jgi:SAM-dependent methyltransferase
LPLVTAPRARVIDFGGAGGPLGLGSLVVDRLERDALGRAVPYASLAAAGSGHDVAFSSHALEHIPALDEALADLHASLRPGGQLLLHLPAFSCERWRAGVHRNERFNDHVWTFGIGPEPAGVTCQSYVDIAARVAATFEVELAEYCGDDSIFLRARRR